MEEKGLLSPKSPRSSGSRSPQTPGSQPQTPDTDVPPVSQGHSRTDDDAATKIQAQMRGYLVRKEIELEGHAAEKIQAAYRGFHVRKEMDGKLHHHQHLNGDKQQTVEDYGTDF